MKLKELKKGDFFTLKPISNPTENQVYIKGEYDRSLKRFFCVKFSDISAWRTLKADTVVYTDFTF